MPRTIDASGFIEVPVVFTPVGAGEDSAIAEVKTVTGTEMPLSVSIHGGPIFPALAFDPDPLDFRPATMPLGRGEFLRRRVARQPLLLISDGQLRSAGRAAMGVLANGQRRFGAQLAFRESEPLGGFDAGHSGPA